MCKHHTYHTCTGFGVDYSETGPRLDLSTQQYFFSGLMVGSVGMVFVVGLNWRELLIRE
jgi:hypothetical protein